MKECKCERMRGTKSFNNENLESHMFLASDTTWTRKCWVIHLGKPAFVKSCLWIVHYL